MPPRIPLSTLAFRPSKCLTSASASSNPIPTTSSALSIRTFFSSPTSQGKSSSGNSTKNRRYRDPYAVAQTKARKAANLSRQAELRREHAAALGHPIYGHSETSPFVAAMEAGIPVSLGPYNAQLKSGKPVVRPRRPGGKYLNHGISENLMRSALQHELATMTPAPPTLTEEERVAWDQKNEEAHNQSMKAVDRIVSLENASMGERKKAVVENCVNIFGRHQTDKFLPPKPRAVSSTDLTSAAAAAATPVPATASELPGFERRVGPDTGSSEVQIAILTTKIRTLASALREHGGPDKMNKRNLRLLVHKRAKLLKYLRRKERGGPRWQHCIETLGLTDATWKYEITDLKL